MYLGACRRNLGGSIEPLEPPLATGLQGHLQLAMNKLVILHTLLESRTAAPKGHVFKMTNFTMLKEKRERWWSPPFYAFPCGYKMCLSVYAGGCGHGKGTHISAYLHLMEGENDKTLEWPMRATFSIELLNQERDQNHKEAPHQHKKTPNQQERGGGQQHPTGQKAARRAEPDKEGKGRGGHHEKKTTREAQRQQTTRNKDDKRGREQMHN